MARLPAEFNQVAIQLLHSKVITSLEDANILIIQDTERDVVPLFCKLCEMPYTSMDDIVAHKDHAVCYMCDLVWYRPLTGHLDKLDKSSEAWLKYIEDKESRLSKTPIVFE